MSSNGGLQGGYNVYLVHFMSNYDCCMLFKDLLFVSNNLYRLKITEMREFLKKNYFVRILCFSILKADRAEHLDTCGR
jgi:hypothetical protein